MNKGCPIAAALAVVLLAGCGAPSQPASGEPSTPSQSASDTERTFFAMDTYMTLRIPGGNEEAADRIEEEITRTENLISTTIEASDIATLNRTGRAEADDLTAQLTERAVSLCEETDGALDITLYPVVRAWGFTTGETKVPAEEELQALLQSVDYREIAISGNEITVPEGYAVDLGSVAKGAVSDRIAEVFAEYRVKDAVADLGGNVYVAGHRADGNKWRVGIRAPGEEGLAGVLEASDEAVITSGGYERFFEDEDGNVWWHIIDPATGYPAKNGLISVTIVSNDGMRADALSTALFVMGTERAVAFWEARRDFDMILVTEEGELMITPDLEDRFTPEASAGYSLRVLSR